MRPALPTCRYNVTWNVHSVLNYLQTEEHLSELALTTHKLLMLLNLLSRKRRQTLHLLDMRNICIYDDFVEMDLVFFEKHQLL